MDKDKRAIRGEHRPVSVKRDMAELKRNSTASIGELREFLAKMKGRKPSEMLGIISQSNLVRCTGQAFLVIVVLLLTFTLAPMAFSGGGDAGAEDKQREKGDKAAKTPDDGDKGSGKQGGDGKDAGKGGGLNVKKPNDPNEAAKKLGIGDAKSPKKEDLDNLIDGKLKLKD